MKPQEHYLELECELYQAREVLRAMLHSVVFHRCLGNGKVQDVDLDVCRVTFSKVVSTVMEEQVENAVRSAQRYLELNDTGVQQVEVKVIIGNDVPTSATAAGGGGWMMWQKQTPPMGKEIWEEWKLNLKIQSNTQLGKPECMIIYWM